MIVWRCRACAGATVELSIIDYSKITDVAVESTDSITQGHATNGSTKVGVVSIGAFVYAIHINKESCISSGDGHMMPIVQCGSCE